MNPMTDCLAVRPPSSTCAQRGRPACRLVNRDSARCKSPKGTWRWEGFIRASAHHSRGTKGSIPADDTSIEVVGNVRSERKYFLHVPTQHSTVPLMLGNPEGKVTSLRVSTPDSRRVCPLYCVAAAVPRPPAGRPAGSSETRQVTRRVSGTLDLAAMFRLPAGGDIAPQFGGPSSRSSSLCMSQEPSRCRGGRKAGGGGRDGCDAPACSDGSFSSG